jgi:hypothetical protein
MIGDASSGVKARFDVSMLRRAITQQLRENPC